MNACRNKGFTLVELMVGMVAAAILALMFGAMLFYGYTGWVRLQAMAEMERSGALAMHTMSRVFRGATATKIKNVSGSSVIVSNVNSIASQSFYRSGETLKYGINGVDRMNLVETGLTAFVCLPVSNNEVRVMLSLRVPAVNMTMSLTNIITLRN